MPYGVHDLPPVYDMLYQPLMLPDMADRKYGPTMPITEPYVSIPPALWIRDEENAWWTLGFDYSDTEWRTGKWEFDVVRNGRKTGEFARTIEFRKNKVRIWGAEGWRTWNGKQFV